MPLSPARPRTLTARQRRFRAEYEQLRPADDDALHVLVRRLLGVDVPRRAMTPGHDAPFEYLAQAYFQRGPSDLVVWANRGGGKTFLGAVATLLDLLFKPGIRVCLLGGSFEQSSRMYSHLLKLVDRPLVRPMLATQPTRDRIVLVNGSRARVLCQSQRSVRGIRVQRLRCDEVEMFDPAVWEAAQFVTRSERCGPTLVRGGIEALSTMHEPYGVMAKVVDQARGHDGSRVLRWGAMDVAARCEPQRSCDGCVLWRDCEGRARQATGFIPIADLIAQRRRVSDEQWSAEMLCRRPSRRNQVYPTFDATPGGRHVTAATGTADDRRMLIAGMDFGLRNPLAMVWARVACVGDDPLQWTVEVIDEYAQADRVLDTHLDAIESRGHPTPAWIGVDPAGRAANAQTGRSDIQCLQRRGWRVLTRAATITHGLDIVRRRLDHRTLRISDRCPQLIQAMNTYHYAPDRTDCETPVKDGPDHLCDALRYMLVCLEHRAGTIRTATY
jgi:hypothetical protein